MSICSVLAFHARISARPAHKVALAVLEAASSTSALASLRNSLRNGSSSKTSPAAQSSGSTQPPQSWNGSAMRSYRSRCRRAMLALCIRAPASSLLPTLTGSGNALSPDSQKWPAHRRLAERAKLPTLTRSDDKRSFQPSSATREGSASLKETIGRKLLPTLTASSYGTSNNGTRDGVTEFNLKGKPSLASLAGASLSPTWCEWLMSFPKHWTQPGCEHLETPLWSGVLKRSGGSSES